MPILGFRQSQSIFRSARSPGNPIGVMRAEIDSVEESMLAAQQCLGSLLWMFLEFRFAYTSLWRRRVGS